MVQSARHHETAVAASTDWRTPSSVFEALGTVFDLDPCAPSDGAYPGEVYCRAHYRLPVADGLLFPWHGMVWLNPPFSSQLATPWLERAITHGSVIALLPARPDTYWCQDLVLSTATAGLWLRGRLSFIRPDGSTGAANGVGSLFAAWGDRAADVLMASTLVGSRWG